MKIKALKPFCYRDPTSGALTSYAMNEIADIDSDLASAFIEEGLAEEYKLLEPTGTKSITENGTNIDVAQYAKVDVAVPEPTGTKNITENGSNIDIAEYAKVDVAVSVVTVTYNVNGGTGTVAPVSVGKGTEIQLDSGTGITAPEGKTFAGWATTNDAEAPDVTSPYNVTADITLYAVYTSTV